MLNQLLGITLDPRDVGLVHGVMTLDTRPTAATTVATRTFLLLANRPAWKLVIYELLPDLKLLPIKTIDGLKDSSGCLIVQPDRLIVLAGIREVDVAGSPFPLHREEIVVPGVWPIDLAAALRVRNIARIVTKHLPAAAKDLAPYVK